MSPPQPESCARGVARGSGPNDLWHSAALTGQRTLFVMNTPKTHANEHLVSDGWVNCQRAGRDVSVEICWMCDRLIDFTVDDKIEVVRCSPIRVLVELLPAVT